MTNHYTTASGDSPAWIGVTGGAWTRNILGIGGDLAATQDSTGTVTLQLANLHGDIVATADDNTSATAIANYAESDEFGIPYFSSTAYTRYGWLGAKQRSRDTLGGLTLMGVRLYNPLTGRFLQTDPVSGGSASRYDYTNQDPVNGGDLQGLCDTPAEWCVIAILKNSSPIPWNFALWNMKYHGRYWTSYGVSGGRVYARYGNCSSSPEGVRGIYNFHLACQTHDLGYDLLRYFRIGGSARRAVDWLFYGDMNRSCQWWNYACRNAASTYYTVVAANSARQRYRTP
ncbi:phospholipase A2 [Frankia sp. Mgl5]|nr:phospholipase A2 [Frankia sp. Mgl5]